MQRIVGGREGYKKPGSSVLLGCASYYTTSRGIFSYFDMDPVEDMLYLSRPLFTKIVSFLSERRERGRER